MLGSGEATGFCNWGGGGGGGGGGCKLNPCLGCACPKL